MSEREGRGFAYIRKAECEALTRCKPSAAAALIYIRSVLATREDQPFLCGSRDFGACGLGRDAAAGALQDLEREGVIRCDDRGNFTRGKKASWRLVHTRETAKNTAGKPANPKSDTAGKPANSGRKTRQLDENTAGKPATLKDTPAPAEQERGAGVSSVEDSAQAERRQALKDSLLRIERAAIAVAMTDAGFIQKAGGREPADFLARKFARGELNALELRARLAESEQGAFEDRRQAPARRLLFIGGAG